VSGGSETDTSLQGVDAGEEGIRINGYAAHGSLQTDQDFAVEATAVRSGARLELLEQLYRDALDRQVRHRQTSSWLQNGTNQEANHPRRSSKRISTGAQR
jgi:hypothetical protein